MNVTFLTRCALLCYLVCSSEEVLSNNRQRGYCGSFGWAVFSPGDNTTVGTQECATKMISSLAWHESSYLRNVCADHRCDNTAVNIECFPKGMLALWCFNTPKKGGKDERTKSKNFISHAD